MDDLSLGMKLLFVSVSGRFSVDTSYIQHTYALMDGYTHAQRVAWSKVGSNGINSVNAGAYQQFIPVMYSIKTATYILIS